MHSDFHVERGHPRNRILIENDSGGQALVDTTGLTWEMLGAARTAMDPSVYRAIESPDLRAQDLLVAYARQCADLRHLYDVWHAIPRDDRYGPPGDERIRFKSFFLALRRWRLESARAMARHVGERRQWGAGLLFHPGREPQALTEQTSTSRVPPTWQVIPEPDASDYEARWSIPLTDMTVTALRAGHLNNDEIAAEWPRSLSADRSDRFDFSPLGRPFLR